MTTKGDFITLSDGAEIWTNKWLPADVENIKAVIQLHHGLAEHSLRYDRFGSILAENGFVFNAFDMRGHGRTAEMSIANKTGDFGKLADKNGFNLAVKDVDFLIDLVNKERVFS